MTYDCIDCNYKTNRPSNLKYHETTEKHQQNIAIKLAKQLSIQQVNKQINQNMCEYCKNSFGSSKALTLHYKICKDIKNLQINCENKIKEIQNQYENKIKDFESKIESNNEKMELKNETIKILEKHNEYLKSTLSASGVILNKSVSTLQYIMNTYKTSPPFKIMDNIPSIENNGGDYDNDAPDDTDPITKNTKFVEILIYKYKNDSLIKYLGDFIIKNYKKGDPKQQSIWNSDTARMSYIIRHQIDENNAEWRSDKKGVLATKIAIDPLLKYVEESIVKYYASPNMQMNPNDASYESLYERIEGVTKMKQYIEEKIVSANILKYIAPYFYLTKDDNLMCIK